MKLKTWPFATSCAILFGVGFFIATWWVIWLDGYSSDPNLISSFYRGFEFTLKGSIISFAWGALDGFTGGFIFSWLYNKLAA